jgi:D-3-phosphoglycerate dehydrogenase / 2-oxoglutarate reductase
MLINITYIDDLPEVRTSLKSLCQKISHKYLEINSPTFSELLRYSNDLKIIFCNPNKLNFRFDKLFFQNFKNLKCICTASTGTIHIDLSDAKNFNVDIISIKDDIKFLESVTSTADLALTLSLTGLRKTFTCSNDFFNNSNWNFENFIGKQIKDINILTFGYGRLGKIFSKYMYDLGANVRIFDKKFTFSYDIEYNEILEHLNTFDLISLHIHAEDNINLINEDFFNNLKHDVVLVNTSRGEIVNESSLFDFLKINCNSYYLTDVITDETNSLQRSRYLKFYNENKNLVVTQHIGGMSVGSRKLAFMKAFENLKHYINNA